MMLEGIDRAIESTIHPLALALGSGWHWEYHPATNAYVIKHGRDGLWFWMGAGPMEDHVARAIAAGLWPAIEDGLTGHCYLEPTQHDDGTVTVAVRQ